LASIEKKIQITLPNSRIFLSALNKRSINYEYQISKALSAFTVGKLTIKTVLPCTFGYGSNGRSLWRILRKCKDYYIERAKGGTGLIITGITNVDYNEISTLLMPCAAYMPLMFAKSTAPMNEIIHAFGAKIFLQLTGGFGRVAIPHLMKKAIAPSDQENRWDRLSIKGNDSG